MFLLWILLSVFSYVSGQGILKPFPALNNVLAQSLSHGGEVLSSWGHSQGSRLVGEVAKLPKRKAAQKDAPIPHPKAQRNAQDDVSQAPPQKTTFRSQGQKRGTLHENNFAMPVVATHESPQSSVQISPKHHTSSHPSMDEVPSIGYPKNTKDEKIEEIQTPQSSPKSVNVPPLEEPKPAQKTSAPSQAEESPASEELKPTPQTSNTSLPAEEIPTPTEPKPTPRASSSSSQNQEVPPAPKGPTPSNSPPQEEGFRGAPPPPPPPPPFGTFKPKPQKKSAPKPQDSTPAGPSDAPKTAYSFMDELKKKFKRNAPAATAQSSTATDAPEAEEPPMTDAERMASTRGSVPQNVKPKIWGGRKNGMIGPDHPDYDTWFKKDEARREAERSQPKATTDKPIKSDASKRSKINEWLKKNKAQAGKPAGLGGLFADIQNKRKEKKDAAPENAPQPKRKSSKGGQGYGVTDDVLKTVKLNKTERKVPETPKAEDNTAHGFKAHVLKSHTLRSKKQETKQTTPTEGVQSKDNKAEDLKATPSGSTDNESKNATQTPGAGLFNTAKTSLPDTFSSETKPAAFATPLQTPKLSDIPQETPLSSTKDAQTSEPVARKLNFSITTPKLTRDQLRKKAKERRRANMKTVPVSSNAAFTPPTQEKLGSFATPEPASKQTPFKLSKSNKRSPAKKFIGAHRLVKTPPQQIPDSLPVNEITLTRLKPVGTPLNGKAPLYFAAKATPYTPPKSERAKAAQSSSSATSSFPVSSAPVMSPEKENTPTTPQQPSTSTTGPVKKFLHTLFGKKTAKAPVVSIPLKDMSSSNMSSSTTSSAPSDENAGPNNRQRQNLKAMAQKRVMAFKRREGLSRHADD